LYIINIVTEDDMHKGMDRTFFLINVNQISNLNFVSHIFTDIRSIRLIKSSVKMDLIMISSVIENTVVNGNNNH
jgi:hypothetical protein